MPKVSFYWFIISSMTLGVGTFRMIFSLFRFKFTRYIKEILIFLFINYSIYYYTLHYPELAKHFELIYVFIVCAFLMFVIRIPIFWSLFISILGTIASFTGQVLVIGISHFFYPVSPRHLWSDPLRFCLYCVLTGATNYLLAWLLYRRGLGFTFELDRPPNWIEKLGIIVFIIAMFTTLGNFIMDKSMPSHITVFILIIEHIGLLGYAIWKEVTHR